MKDVFFIVRLFEDDIYGGDGTLFPKVVEDLAQLIF
jgi:hypothetical protein